MTLESGNVFGNHLCETLLVGEACRRKGQIYISARVLEYRYTMFARRGFERCIEHRQSQGAASAVRARVLDDQNIDIIQTQQPGHFT